MTFHDLVAANLIRKASHAPVDSRTEDRYYVQYGKPALPPALRINAPILAAVVLVIVGVVAV